VRAVGAIGDELAFDQGTDGVGDPTILIVKALRAVGGITAVLESVISETVSAWEMNPRVRPRAAELANNLQRQLPVLRPRVQHYLNRVDLSGLGHGREPGRVKSVEGGERPVKSLSPGLHAEVSLVNDELGWYGKADLMRVSADAEVGDEIIDFKTGSPKPDHAYQLRIYALLWAHDKRRNLSRSRARKLTVLYGDGPVDVPAPVADVDLLGVANELRERTAQARAAIEQMPPAACPSREACEWCDVRQMCPAYWEPSRRPAIAAAPNPTTHAVDADVHIVQRQGAWSWIAIVRELGLLSEHVVVGARVLLRARPRDEHFGSLISVGRRLRIIGAQYVEASEESGSLGVLSLTRATEGFLQP
jgi:hypothetical protein